MCRTDPDRRALLTSLAGCRAGSDGDAVSMRVVRSGTGSPAVAVGGDLDLDCAPALQQLIAVTASRCPAGQPLELDLREVTFCDCSGLRVLMAARERQLARGGSLCIVAAGPAVLRLLEISGVAHLFAIGRPDPRGGADRAEQPEQGQPVTGRSTGGGPV
ncbi:STAS domain-containing protein [Streptacidiphilus sp. PB12-B1b]|uniref:STAS domain-containing protein n=1 Tax=Streptacidiphilus sp. PB12-B1b TaxID=2705012 RepID=UPI0015FE2D19|nr:STAS domain-containing protein [Streptacidiphilus sp. PB12-B1b]QMU76717.1 STAS domain-containing protein [Streptacidiphilus sp. PB12-B1b]